MDKSLPFAWSPTVSPRWHRTARRNASLGRQAGAAAAAACIALAAWFAWMAWPRAPAQDAAPVDTHTFAHWQGGGRDWLLKLEPAQGTLSVYDAGDGRPLRRLVVPGARAIVLEDDWLFVLGPASPRLLRLPGLAPRQDGGHGSAQP